MNNEELARRAVACKHWRWLPGMLELESCDRVFDVDSGVVRMAETDCEGERYYFHVGDEYRCPDLTDPATLGCLLALVREARRDAYINVVRDGGGWFIRTWDSEGNEEVFSLVDGCGLAGSFGSEAEALVAALEATDE